MNYMYEELKHLPEAELRKEYTKLRDIAQKRLNRLSKDQYTSKSQTYLNYKDRFKSLKELKTKSQVARSLDDLQRFLSLQSSTVTGQKRQIDEEVRRFKEKGYKFITKDNIREFWEYLEFNRSLKRGGAYDSERVLEMMAKVQELNATVTLAYNDFTWWMENYHSLKEAPDRSGDQGSGKWKRTKYSPFQG